jgi:hypothetical protein
MLAPYPDDDLTIVWVGGNPLLPFLSVGFESLRLKVSELEDAEG